MAEYGLAGRIAALLTGILLWSVAGTAAAVDFELPGERRMSVNGFYEMRLNFVGEDLPANGFTFSQFRHVLNIETETELFPDGVGPFDFMLLWTRWIVAYECIYDRACGLAKSADSYGGARRSVNLHPRTLGAAHTSAPWVAGLIPQPSFRRTLRPSSEKLNPDRRFRGWINAPGQLSNPNPFAGLANLNARSQLDRPLDESLNPNYLTRSGAYNWVANINLLASARSTIETRENSGLIPVGSYDMLYRKIISDDTSFLSALPQIKSQGFAKFTPAASNFERENHKLRGLTHLRGLNAAIARGEATSEQIEERNRMLFGRASDCGGFVDDLVDGGISTAQEALDLCTDASTTDPNPFFRDIAQQRNRGDLWGLLAPSEEDLLPENIGETAMLDALSISPDLYDDYRITEFIGEESADELKKLNLLSTRPDPNLFERSANQQAPGLLDSVFAALQRSKGGGVAYLATIDTPMRPLGYLNAAALDYLDHSAAGLAKDIQLVDGDTLPFGLSVDLKDVRNDLISGFIGPDGHFNTRDDLPFAVGHEDRLTKTALADAVGDFFSWTTALHFESVVTVNDLPDERPEARDSDVVFYAVYDSDYVGSLAQELTQKDPGRFNSPDEAFEAGCVAALRGGTNRVLTTQGFGGILSPGGVNADGDCIELNTSSGSYQKLVQGKPTMRGVHIGLLATLGDRTLRPATAILEPGDSTDILAMAEQEQGRTLPARPRLITAESGGSLAFRSPGVQKLLLESHGVVSSLDLDFREDELRWGHGGSDDEHEFREGYLEFEMFDGSFFGRFGKLLMVWGKTELLRNQDRLNPLDMSNGVITRLEESRIAQWALNFTISPEAWMRVGPVEDLRLELAVILDDYESVDLGKCGESGAIALVCAKGVGVLAHGLVGIGLVGEVRPDKKYRGGDEILKRLDFGVRIEGRWNRITFALTDFWGWDDGFLVEPVQQYGRRVDPQSGAPVRATGELRCDYRTAGGGHSSNLGDSVGPDGVRGTNDDRMPTMGNCLLWQDPESPDARQLLADPGFVARNHAVNQQLFHTICTYTFDPDSGYCVFDRLNAPSEFALISQALSGKFDVVTDLATSGMETIKLEGQLRYRPQWPRGWTAPRGGAKSPVFRAVAREGFELNSEGAMSFNSPAQAALMGCGPSWGSACGGFDQAAGTSNFLDGPGDDPAVYWGNVGLAWSVHGDAFRSNLGFLLATPMLDPNDPANLADPNSFLRVPPEVYNRSCAFNIRLQRVVCYDTSSLDALGVANPNELSGGLDFMNADGSVLTQDFSILRVGSPGALVGTRTQGIGGPLRWEAGITIAGDFDTQPTALLATKGLTTTDFANRDLEGRAQLLEEHFGFDFNVYTGDLDHPLLDTDPDTPGVQFDPATDTDLPGMRYLGGYTVEVVDDPYEGEGLAIGARAGLETAPVGELDTSSCDSVIEDLDLYARCLQRKVRDGNAVLEASSPLHRTVKPSDGWVEPFPWRADPEALARGDVLFMVADQGLRDLRCDPARQPDPADPTSVVGLERLDQDEDGVPDFTPDEKAYCGFRNSDWTPATARMNRVNNDPTDWTNPLNQFIDLNGNDDPRDNFVEALRVAENCSAFPHSILSPMAKTDFSEGCTQLEFLSTNLERLFTVFDIIGSDQMFDAPETLVELQNMLDGNWATNALGDPWAGPDGIFSLNYQVFDENDEYDFQVTEHPELTPGPADTGTVVTRRTLEDRKGNPADPLTQQEFFDLYAPEECTASASCFFLLNGPGEPVDDPFSGTRTYPIVTLPISYNAHTLVDGTVEEIKVNLARLGAEDPAALNDLLAGREVVLTNREDVQGTCLGNGGCQPELYEDVTRTVFMRSAGASTILFELLSKKISEGTAKKDLWDLDQDRDGVWDGADDFTRGPITDDNIFCGSGITGDVLQKAVQLDFSTHQMELATEAFGTRDDGSLDFQGRSPTQCGGPTGIAGATGQTLPFRRAGGDGTWGRRDFMWHGGRELAFTHQKNNVLGFAFDFAEDRTASSWGIEGSWTADKRVSNTRSYTGYSKVDDFFVSISIDRPTFFNFINPNRSFFVNFQFFVRYIKGYKGSRSERDGMWGVAEGPWSTLITLTAFTGYFQDRLSPGVTFAVDPTTMTAAAFWRVGYKFTANFSTGLRMNQFWGNPTPIQKSYFPALLNSNRRMDAESGRGISVVRNRDEVFWNVRYSW